MDVTDDEFEYFAVIIISAIFWKNPSKESSD